MTQPFHAIKNLSPQQRLLLEQRLQEKRKPGRPEVTIPVRQAGTHPPLSFAQERLWFLYQLYPDSAFYNIPFALELSGSVDIGALEKAFTQIIARHEILRTTFQFIEEHVVQVIVPTTELRIVTIDLRALSPTLQAAYVTSLSNEEGRIPFDLSIGPLLRLKLLLIEDGVVVLLTLHHIISDGWSTNILIEEIEQCYTASLRGEIAHLPTLPIQYADYAAWQQQWLNETRMEPLLAYWTKQLADLPVLQLPTDYVRPLRPTNEGALCEFRFSEALSTKVRRLCQQEHVTAFIFLLAAFYVLLARYSRQDDIAVGIPVSNRQYPELEHLIGFLTNTLVLRANLTGDPSFRVILAQVRELLLNAYTYQDLPFEKLVEALHPQRELSYTPLFQVMFNFQKSKKELHLPGLATRFILPLKETSIFDLSVNIEDDDICFSGFFEYNKELFVSASIEHMIENFQTLLEAIINDIEQPISQLALVSATSQQLLHQWNTTEHLQVPDACLHTLFEAQVERTPDALAVVYDQHALSYDELNRHANMLAHYLCQQGVKPEITVGLFLERSVEMIIALFAVFKAGGVAIPFDIQQPPARQSLMVADAHLHLMITMEPLLPLVSQSYHDQVLCLDQMQKTIGEQSTQNLTDRVTPEHLAYIVYTSGSTGTPKGIMAEHAAVVNFCCALNQAISTPPDETLHRVGLNSPLTFDASMYQVQCLLRGQTLYVIPQQIRADGHEFLTFLDQTQLDAFDTTPTQLRLLLASGFLSTHPAAPRIILSTGEPIDKALWSTLSQASTTTFYNVYGPTECTVYTTSCPLKPGSHPSLGHPLADRQIHILDKQLSPVPIGVPGELFIGGPGLSRGYVGQPDITAAAFIPHPFSEQPGMRLYRTGDAARFRWDGSLEFLGRLDWQIKFHGFRIELGEIEAVISKYPGILQAIVLLREDRVGDQQLVAYISADAQQAIEMSALRTYLKQHLPHYMVPSRIIVLDSLPMNANGKVNRRALPSPQSISHEQSSTYIAPRNDLERRISAIWCSILGIESVGISDNFFDLGGHSLSLVQVHQRIQASFNIRFSLIELYAHPTVGSVAAYLLHRTVPPTDDPPEQGRGISQREALIKQKRISKHRRR